MSDESDYEMYDFSPNTSTGGSQATRKKRKRKPKLTAAEKKERARNRAVEKLGDEEAKAVLDNWNNLETEFGGKDWETANGIIINLINTRLSDIEIRSFLKIGSSRLSRIREYMSNPEPKPKHVPSHSATDDDKKRIIDHINSYEKEDGYPCSHRRPRKYFIDIGLTYGKIHEDYREKMENQGHRFLSYSRFTQYLHYFFPGLRLTRSTEDDCDCCVRIDILLADPSISDERKEELELEKSIHLDEAIEQRRAVKSFINVFVKGIDPENDYDLDKFVVDVLPDNMKDLNEEPDEEKSEFIPKVRVQYEDFGGSVALPHYGFSRPSVDYYQSNLILNNFVISDANSNVNYVYAYDERSQGKDGEAMCSLRMNHHLTTLNQANPGTNPMILVSARDNCVGQNKSHLTMMFSCFLSITLYERVVLVFYKTGHSHMKADRVVAWCRNQTRGYNLYDGDEIVNKWNEVNTVQAEFVSHENPDRYFHVGWSQVLSKYIEKLPSGFTRYHFFEFYGGKCLMRENCSLDSPGKEISLVSHLHITRKAILNDLFGTSDVSKISMKKLNLPIHNVIELDKKKIASISKKYPTIPEKYLTFYPKYDSDNVVRDDEEEIEEAVDFVKDPRGHKSRKEKCLSNLNQGSIIGFLVPQEKLDYSAEMDKLIGMQVQVLYDDEWFLGTLKERISGNTFRVFFEADSTSSIVKYPFGGDVKFFIE